MLKTNVAKKRELTFRECAESIGINKPYLAEKLKGILSLPPEKYHKEILAAARMTLANMGEVVESGDKLGMTMNGPVMVILGMTPRKIRALREAGADNTPAVRPVRKLAQTAQTPPLCSDAQNSDAEEEITDAETEGQTS